jgi:hypothetical protein
MVVTYIFLLFVHMSNLEPDIGMGERAGRIAENTIKASQRILVLALLLVYDSQAEEDFVGLVEI